MLLKPGARPQNLLVPYSGLLSSHQWFVSSVSSLEFIQSLHFDGNFKSVRVRTVEPIHAASSVALLNPREELMPL